jgi:hypothetical protein
MFTLQQKALISLPVCRSGASVKVDLRPKRTGRVCAAAYIVALLMLIAVLGTVGCTAAAEPQSNLPQSAPSIPTQSYEGMVSDAHCGAKHSAAMGQTATKCTLACVHAGERFVLIDGDTVYPLEGNLIALKDVAGQRVRIVGTLNGTTISVTSVTTA